MPELKFDEIKKMIDYILYDLSIYYLMLIISENKINITFGNFFNKPFGEDLKLICCKVLHFNARITI